MRSSKNQNLRISSTSVSPIPLAPFLSPRLPPAHRALLSAHAPPLSPSLPSLVPRHGKTQANRHGRLVWRLLVTFCGIAFLGWLGARRLYSIEFLQLNTKSVVLDAIHAYETAHGTSLPSKPSAILVTDKAGKLKWSVSIPTSQSFPLRPEQYLDICKQSEEVSRYIALTHNILSESHRPYYQPDPSYLDVSDAQAQELLPYTGRFSTPKGYRASEGDSLPTCDRSLTFVLETSDAGLGKTLMQLWMSYGLAQREGRAFFIDDTRWPYGEFSDYFELPALPSCRPPPTSQIVPCPHTARHIVVSAVTVPYTFGHGFAEEYGDSHKHDVARQRRIYDLARAGFENLFKLRAEDSRYVADRAQSLYAEVASKGGLSVGMHIRRGDRHPYEYQYSNDYLPLARYVDAARELVLEHVDAQNSLALPAALEEAIGRAKPRESWDDLLDKSVARIVIASDDPDIYTAPEVARTIRAQDRIVLASKKVLEAATGSAYPRKNQYIDEISGWEGGFFHDVFWSLGQPVSSAVQIEQLRGAAVAGAQDAVSQQVMQLRELVARAYLLDLAVLSQADAIVCTVSSLGCRLLAVMMGWQRAIEEDRWRNIDGKSSWEGLLE